VSRPREPLFRLSHEPWDWNDPAVRLAIRMVGSTIALWLCLSSHGPEMWLRSMYDLTYLSAPVGLLAWAWKQPSNCPIRHRCMCWILTGAVAAFEIVNGYY
jgi:hypothetical protein